jgi:hypothetical protein
MQSHSGICVLQTPLQVSAHVIHTFVHSLPEDVQSAGQTIWVSDTYRMARHLLQSQALERCIECLARFYGFSTLA